MLRCRSNFSGNPRHLYIFRNGLKVASVIDSPKTRSMDIPRDSFSEAVELSRIAGFCRSRCGENRVLWGKHKPVVEPHFVLTLHLLLDTHCTHMVDWGYEVGDDCIYASKGSYIDPNKRHDAVTDRLP